MPFVASTGKLYNGPLATDRPNTGKVFGHFRQKSRFGETTLGLSQFAFQGTPISTGRPVIGPAAATS